MATTTIGIIVNGATGRIGSTQHLANALVPIMREGGLAVGRDRIMPRVKLVGRDAQKLQQVAAAHGLTDWSTDLGAALTDAEFSVLFDAAATSQRKPALDKAIAAGKHIYTEKPVALTADEGRALLAAAQARGVKHGAVEDKQYLPGLQKLARLARAGFFGRVVGFRLEFGWWVFDGIERTSQRPSWNYTRAGGGGLILDMYPHWRYVIESLLGRIRRIATLASTAMPERADEARRPYRVDVEDTATTLVELKSGAVGAILSSWATRVRRDDLMTLQIDGTDGSAIAGLHRCRVQSSADTPAIKHFNPTTDLGVDYGAAWRDAPEAGPYANPYRVGWEDFLRHVATGAPLKSDLAAGLRDLEFAEACRRSAATGAWVEMTEPA
ncbi:MAG TPA: Gfo/Idh/MocA family oxidoreductase [Xanthobacteraceae bacterium]|nr:Gfo/Idh/MocA family oxidoreductase [Xanthobacteraceae bacterium]